MVSAVVSAVSLEGRIVATAVTAVIAVARWTRVGDVVVKARLRELPPPGVDADWVPLLWPAWRLRWGRRGGARGGVMRR